MSKAAALAMIDVWVQNVEQLIDFNTAMRSQAPNHQVYDLYTQRLEELHNILHMLEALHYHISHN